MGLDHLSLEAEVDAGCDAKVLGAVGNGIKSAAADSARLGHSLVEYFFKGRAGGSVHEYGDGVDLHRDALHTGTLPSVPDGREDGFLLRVPGRERKAEGCRKEHAVGIAVLFKDGLHSLPVQPEVHYEFLVRLVGSVPVGDDLRLQLGCGAEFLCIPLPGFREGVALSLRLFLQGDVGSAEAFLFQGRAVVCI